MQSSLAPLGRAIRRPLVGWSLPIWRVCQREAPHPVAGGGHWRRSDRDGPVADDDLDAGPARDGEVVLTRARCATVVPTRGDRNLRRGVRHGGYGVLYLCLSHGSRGTERSGGVGRAEASLCLLPARKSLSIVWITLGYLISKVIYR